MEHIRRTCGLLPHAMPSTAHNEMQRFCQLLQAFVHLAVERSDLQLRGSASPPPLGFAVRLQPEPWSSGVELSLFLNEVRLCSWGHDGGYAPDRVRQRRVSLSLRTGFLWECLLFPDADQLARALLRRMEDELSRTR